MKLNKTTALVARKGFTLVELLVVIAIIAALAGLSYGPIMKQINAADRTEAISNARSINAALLGFYSTNDQQYPNAATDRSGLGVATSAACFQQLIDNAIVDDEKFFWSKANGRAATVMPDVDINEPDNMTPLDQDENVWTYVIDLDAGDGNTPIFFDSYDGTNFTTETWDGKAIVAYVDGSVVPEQIIFTGLAEDNGVFQAGPVNNTEGDSIVDSPASIPDAAMIVPR